MSSSLNKLVLRMGFFVFGVLVITQFAYSLEILCEPSQPKQTITIQLVTGTNFISLPVMPDDTDLKTIISDIKDKVNVIHYFPGGSSSVSLLTYVSTGVKKDGQRFLVESGDLRTLEAGKGYIFIMLDPATLTVTGIPYEFQPISLIAKNWYMIGAPYTDTKLSDLIGTCNLGDIVLSTLDSQNKKIPITVDPNTVLSSGKGYWIKSTSSCTLKSKLCTITSIVNVEEDTSLPYYDTSNDGDTNIVVSGVAGMLCRWYTSDVSYDPSTGAACTTSSAQASCTVSTISGSYTRHVACADSTGKGQSNTQNLDISWVVDFTPPTISSLSHSPATVTDPTDVTIRVEASDASGSGIFKIEIYVDGQLKQKCTSSPCLYIARHPKGVHKYYAEAFDKAGNSVAAQESSFQVVPTEIIPLKRGWNLVSVPYEKFDFILSTCEEGRKLYNYDASKKWNIIEHVRNVEGGKGYWTYSDRTCEIRIVGKEKISSTDIQLVNGWNHIGPPGNAIIGSIDSPCTIQRILYYDETGNWRVLGVNDKLEKYKGYFVKIANCDSGQLTVHRIHRVFATADRPDLYQGNLGGLSGGDAICQRRADNARLGGTWKAWLSDNGEDAKDRIPDAVYYRLDDRRVARNKADLLDRTIENPINVDENNVFIRSSNTPWTGTNERGTHLVNNCNNWMSNSNSVNGDVGLIDDDNTRYGVWTDSGTFTCDVRVRLYCFEVEQ